MYEYIFSFQEIRELSSILEYGSKDRRRNQYGKREKSSCIYELVCISFAWFYIFWMFNNDWKFAIHWKWCIYLFHVDGMQIDMQYLLIQRYVIFWIICIYFSMQVQRSDVYMIIKVCRVLGYLQTYIPSQVGTSLQRRRLPKRSLESWNHF